VNPGRRRIRAEDAFFLHVESAAAPQQVGGVAILDISGLDRPLRREDLAALVAARLLPRGEFGCRVDLPGRLAVPRWQVAATVDLGWHVAQTTLPAPTDSALQAFVAAVIEAPLPRDRPLWRCWLVHGLGRDRAAVVVVVHHVLGDGTAVVAHLRHLLGPPPRASDAGLPVSSGSAPGRRHACLSRLRRAAATASGLIQLATDGSVPSLPRGAVTAQRQYATLDVPLAAIRAAARRQAVRVTDLILAAVAGALAKPENASRDRVWPGNRLRAAVTLLLAPAVAKAAGTNRTAAVMVDLPTTPMPAAERLSVVASAARRRRRSGRPLASRLVMARLAALLPPPLHARFARSVYRGRFFGAIVSNMPGPSERLTLLRAPLRQVYPILPLAEEVPLAVGALSWNGMLHLGVTVSASVLPDAAAFAAAMRAELAELGVTPGSGLPTAAC
jgi:WS/DGAT/MGAT family acyltransferase